MSHVDEGTLHALVDNALPPNERATVEAHLATCGDCARHYAEATAMARQVHTLLGALDEAPTRLRVESVATPVRTAARASVNVTPMQRRMRTLRGVALAASVLLVAGISYRVGVTRTDTGASLASDTVRVAAPAALRTAPSVVEAAPEAVAMPAAPTVRVAPRGGPRADVDAPMGVASTPAAPPAPAPLTAAVPRQLAVPAPAGDARKAAIETQVAAAAEAADRSAGVAANRVSAAEASPAARRAAPLAAPEDSRPLGLSQVVVTGVAASTATAAKVDAPRALAGYQAEEDVTVPAQTRRRYVAPDGTTLLLVIVPVDGGAPTPVAKAASEFTVSTTKGKSTVRWQLGNLSYELQGALAPDSLVKLATQLK